LNYQKCGTPSYIAPEVLIGSGYTTKSDLFGVGSIMYNLITGKFLFHSNNVKDLLILNRDCDLSHVPNNTKDISGLGRDLLIRILDKNPEKRLNAK
jgi:serine/threonine protein kinase